VSFDATNYRDPYGEYSKRETISANKTLDIEDNGKLFWVDTDAVHHHPAGGRHPDQLQDRQRRRLRRVAGQYQPERLRQGAGAGSAGHRQQGSASTPRRPRAAAISPS
jgi:hypothetical protein